MDRGTACSAGVVPPPPDCGDPSRPAEQPADDPPRTSADRGAAEPARPAGQRVRLLELLRTTDHKTLGLMYLVTTFLYCFAS
jgi:hypothetical protein